MISSYKKYWFKQDIEYVINFMHFCKNKTLQYKNYKD
jgi:hypothetical protein